MNRSSCQISLNILEKDLRYSRIVDPHFYFSAYVDHTERHNRAIMDAALAMHDWTSISIEPLSETADPG